MVRPSPKGRANERDRTIGHVSLFHIPCPPDFGCQEIGAGHMPFDADALAKSVDTLVRSDASPAELFEGGYKEWKDANGGAFTLSVPEAANLIFKTAPPGSVH